MKKICCMANLIFFFCLHNSSADLYKIDFMFEVTQHPGSVKNVETVEQHVSWINNVTGEKIQTKLTASSHNQTIADASGYSYHTPFAGYFEIANKKILRYRFEGIVPGEDASGDRINKTPLISYKLYMLEIHDGKDFFQETYNIDSADIKRKVVYHNKEINNSEILGPWRNYLQKCLDFEKYWSETKNKNNYMESDAEASQYKIGLNRKFSVSKDNSKAFLTINKGDIQSVITRWNQLNTMVEIFVPEIELLSEFQKQKFSITSLKKIEENQDSIDAVFSIPKDAVEYKLNGIK